VAGEFVFYLKVRDTGGGCDTMRIAFSAAAPSFDKGILVVNGDDPATYGIGALATPGGVDELDPRYSVGAFWGTLPVSFWDLFGTASEASVTLPASGVTYIGGGVQPTPDIMAQYSTIVWLANGYAGDDALWALTPVYAYLQVGGNVVFFGRYGSIFITADNGLEGYLGISGGWRELGWRPRECKAMFPGLVDMPMTGSHSLTDNFTCGAYIDVTDDGIVTNWDKVRGFSKTNLQYTLLFAHRSKTVVPAAELLYVRGMGVWAHPNFTLSSQTAGNEFPGTPEQKKGNFIAIMGRNYRYDIGATTANLEFILRNMCGEQ
jgi:hypothetical protein